MIEIVDIENLKRWNELLSVFKMQDVYYMHAYNMALMIHGDGRPQLIYYEYQGNKLAYVMFERDLAEIPQFKGILGKSEYFDWTSPYGYGGPLYEGDITKQMVDRFKEELFQYCSGHMIISQFFRFHPLLQNHKVLETMCEQVCLKETVTIDTSCHDDIERNMTSECRNRIRKAEKNNIEIFWDKGETVNEFESIYQATMLYHGAQEYYFFEKEYFQYLIEKMNDNIVFFYAKKDGKIISAALFFYNSHYIHYHLGGTLIEYRKFAPVNLLFKSVAYWAYEKQIREFHLGGGIDRGDSLFRFKKNFCAKGIRDYYIGRTIFNKNKYNALVALRAKADSSFDTNINYLIKYRA